MCRVIQRRGEEVYLARGEATHEAKEEDGGCCCVWRCSMGGCAAAARSGFRGFDAACIWRREMEGDGEHGEGARGAAIGGKGGSEREMLETEM